MSAARRKRPRRLKKGMSVRKKVILFLSLLFGLLVMYVFVGGDYGLHRIWSQKRSVRQLQEEIAALQMENDRLEEKKALLTDDLDYIEKIARERYGMKRKGEEVYYIEVKPAEEFRAQDTKNQEDP